MTMKTSAAARIAGNQTLAGIGNPLFGSTAAETITNVRDALYCIRNLDKSSHDISAECGLDLLLETCEFALTLEANRLCEGWGS